MIWRPQDALESQRVGSQKQDWNKVTEAQTELGNMNMNYINEEKMHRDSVQG